MSSENTSKLSKLRQVAATKSRQARSDHKMNQGDQLLGLSAFFMAAVAGVGTAVAFAYNYAENFGEVITNGVAGGVIGGIAGFALPFVLHKTFSGKAIQYLKPSTYKEAFKKTADPAPAAKTQSTPAPQPKV